MAKKYLSFLIINTFNKKAVWISWLIYLTCVFCFLILLPLLAKLNVLQIWANTTMPIAQTFLLFSIAIFTSVLSITIFKDANDEGTELIVISKPMSRNKMFSVKFLSYFLFCLFINLSACLLATITYFLPSTDNQYFSGLIISMFIGNLISFGVFGAISILLTVPFNKVIIILLNILIVMVLFIYQTLSLFVFDTPLMTMMADGVNAETYIYAQRNKDTGTYNEKHLVQFLNTKIDNGDRKDSKIRATDYKGVIDYYKNDVGKRNVSQILNVTDIASQFGLTYDTYQLEKYSDKQASRHFALSRYYDYKLINPTSPELLIDGKQNPNAVDWLYSGFQSVEIPGLPMNLLLPQTMDFIGVSNAQDSISLLGEIKDQIPIGAIAKVNSKKNLVYFESDQWLKYKEGFDEIYNNIYRSDLKDKRTGANYYPFSGESEDYAGMGSAWSSSNENVNKYYELIWGIFSGNVNTFVDNTDPTEPRKQLFTHDNNYFDIKSNDDLNTRFLQYKYYSYYRNIDKQKEVLSAIIPTVEKAAKDYITSTFFTNFGIDKVLGIKFDSDTWAMSSNKSTETKVDLLGPDIQTIAFNIMQITYQWLADDGEIDAAKNSTWAKMVAVQNITRSSIKTKEQYLFIGDGNGNIGTTPKRESNISGQIYINSATWYPYPAVESIHMGANMSIFWYDAIPKTKFYYYVIFWALVAVGLYIAGIIIYRKYDIR